MSRDRTDEFYDGNRRDYGTAAETDETRPSTGGTLPVSWPFGYGREHDYEGEAERDERADADEGWFDEALLTTMLVAGVLLFVFPEPATSALGAMLIVAAGIGWLIDWAS